jgi:uncharacterized membrane protein YbhN (UPF0104 family)
MTSMSEIQQPVPQGRIPYRLLSVVLSLGLLAVGIAVVYHRIDWRSVTEVWSKLDPKLVALAVAVYWLQYPVNAFRIERVIRWTTGRPPSETPSYAFLFRLTGTAGFVAVAAPIGLAGDAAKIAALRVFSTLSLTDATRCALFDRVVGVQWLCVAGLATLPYQVAAGIGSEVLVPQLVIFCGMIAGIGVLLILPRVLSWIRNVFIDRVARIFADYHRLLWPRRSLVQFLIASVNLLFSWGTLYLLLQAAGLTVNPWLVASFIPLLQLINGLPFLYMGWGGREIAMTTTLGAAGHLTISETLAVSIIWGAVLIMSSAANGVFLIGNWQRGAKALSEPSSGAGRPK